MKGFSYRGYVLVLLAAILVCNYLDRWVLSLLLEDIRHEFNLSDSQLGMLTGIAFALFYSLMGVPIARWADTGNRKSIISLTTGLWSLMVMLCGLVTSFVQLLLVRVGVAVGEAGALPPAYSFISDYFKRGERERAIAFYMLGLPISVILGNFLGGWLNELYGWRVTFILAGLPGLLLLVIVKLTLREPRLAQASTMSNKGKLQERPLPPMSEVAKSLWGQKTYRHLVMAYVVGFFFSIGVGQWLPAFYIRIHGMETGELGTWYALIWGGAGIVGTLLSGEIAARFFPQKEHLQLRILAVVQCFLVLTSLVIYLAPDKFMALGAMSVTAILGATMNVPLFALIQALVPSNMQATSIALLMLLANLIGMGFGPLAVGVFSDVLSIYFGEQSLRYALVLIAPGYAWVSLHLWRASVSVGADLGHGPRNDGDGCATIAVNADYSSK